MKRLYTFFSVIVVLAMCFCGTAFADSSYTADNVVILGPFMGPTGTSAPTEAIKVLFAEGQTVDIAVGDVLEWDLMYGDGYRVRLSTSDAQSSVYAGVAITVMHSPDDGTCLDTRGKATSTGYMAIRGYCKAKCAIGGVTAGDNLQLNLGSDPGSFITSSLGNSADIGTLLFDGGTDPLMPVWLR